MFDYKPYQDYEVEVYDCFGCGCRFVPRDPNIYEKLHSQSSGYSSHDEYAIQAEKLFQSNAPELKSFLSQIEKNKFVIETIESFKGIKNILEIGCSCGYLTSHFIANEYSILGVDVAPSAIKKACEKFGDYFVLSGDKRIESGAPYDAIYHAGTIGCVDSPIETTIELLALLRPGGYLVFNAPNRDSCDYFGVPWVMGTQPPDLVTLFSERFWVDKFGEYGDVTVEIKKAHKYAWPAYKLQSILNYRPSGKLFNSKSNSEGGVASKPKIVTVVKGFLELITKLPIFPSIPADFGLMIVIQKR